MCRQMVSHSDDVPYYREFVKTRIENFTKLHKLLSEAEVITFGAPMSFCTLPGEPSVDVDLERYLRTHSRNYVCKNDIVSRWPRHKEFAYKRLPLSRLWKSTIE